MQTSSLLQLSVVREQFGARKKNRQITFESIANPGKKGTTESDLMALQHDMKIISFLL